MDVLRVFQNGEGRGSQRLPGEAEIRKIEGIYARDAFHSLSIERYCVTSELLAQTADESWIVDEAADIEVQRNAMAAYGYYRAFRSVLRSLREICAEADVEKVVERGVEKWYRGLFSAGVRSGRIFEYELAGYRSGTARIAGAEHVPPSPEMVPELMECFFELLAEETSRAVQAVLGHFFFVHIHPYADGNGRTARFILNAFLVAGGYPWTVIRVENRDVYFAALERASAYGDIEEFARFVAGEMAV